MTTDTSTNTSLRTVLGDLERVVGSIKPGQLNDPTPCPDFTVDDLRNHVLGWLTFFAAAVNDPKGETERPDPAKFQRPSTASDAAGAVADAAANLVKAASSGAADGDIKLTQGAMPGGAALQLILWEYLVHGWDLATATGQPWQPPADAAETSLTFAQGMLTPEWRGKDFGDPVEVPADASALDKVLGFTGRDPSWRAQLS